MVADRSEQAIAGKLMDCFRAPVYCPYAKTEPNAMEAKIQNTPLIAELEKIMVTLRQSTGASRTTLRLDVPDHNCYLDTVCCEALAPGVAALKLDSSLNQMSLATVQWLQSHHDLLIQDDCANAEVKPPTALMSGYGVQAQMLCPLIAQEQLRGWISVHDVTGTHEWNNQDIVALRHAGENAQNLLQKSGWLPC